MDFICCTIHHPYYAGLIIAIIFGDLLFAFMEKIAGAI